MNDATAKTRRLVKWLVWGAAGLVSLLVLTWVGFGVAGARRLARAIEELQGGGYATSLKDLAPPAVPDERNGAADYEAAFGLLPADEIEALETAHDEPFAGLGAEEKAAVLDLLGKSGPLFEKIRSGRRRGGYRFERDYARGFAMELPGVSGMMGVSKLLRLRAQAEAAAARTSEAREAVRDILALGEAYRREPLLIFQLVRFASLALAVDAVHLCVTAERG